MSNILIEANKISKVYDADLFLHRGINFYALHQVDFIVKEGDFISVMGPSGSGKSTLLNCISTLDSISSGSLNILDKPASTLNDTEMSNFRYEYLGFIFQNHNLISTLSIFDNIATPVILGNRKPEEITIKIQELATRLNITSILHKKPNECSGGEKQRAAIARALVNDPKLIICDEPTGNLDSLNSHEVLSVLSDLNKQGISIVIVTHDNMIASYAKTFMYLRDAQIHTVLHRNDADQVDFFNGIVKVTTQDSLLKFFSKNNSSTTNKISNQKVSSPLVDKETMDTSERKIREKVYAIFESNTTVNKNAQKSRPLLVSNDKISYTNVSHEFIAIYFSDINSVKITLKPHLQYGYVTEYLFYVIIDIVTSQGNYPFLLLNTDDLTPLFTVFMEHNIQLADPINIQELYRKHPDYLARTRYLQSQLKRLKKEFNI